MLEASKMVQNMGREYIHGRMEISTKEISRTVSDMVKGYKHGQMGRSM